MYAESCKKRLFFLPPDTHTIYSYQGVKNVCFSETFAYTLNFAIHTNKNVYVINVINMLFYNSGMSIMSLVSS